MIPIEAKYQGHQCEIMSKKTQDDNYSVSSSATSQRYGNNGCDDVPIVIASKEQHRVAASKCAMVFVLLVVATGLCAATFALFQKNEVESFERTVCAKLPL